MRTHGSPPTAARLGRQVHLPERKHAVWNKGVSALLNAFAAIMDRFPEAALVLKEAPSCCSPIAGCATRSPPFPGTSHSG
jgi:hypothetical protein